MKKIYISIICLILIVAGLITNNRMTVYADCDNNFTSKSYVLLDADSGTALIEHNAQDKVQVASICKLMTSLITLERIENGALNLDDKIVASEYACSMEGSQAFLDAGSEYTVAELLKSIIVASANDSAVVLAEAISGSESAFTSLMNSRAKELGLNNTCYANATGLPAPNQYSTAMDTSILLKKVASYPTYVNDSHIWMDKFVHPSGRETELVNTNRLIKYYDKCHTGKTGFTDEAGYCLASSASNNGLNLIAVVLKCDKPQDRFKESIDLYNYGFANYTNKKIIDSTSDYMSIKVGGGKVKSAKVGYESDYCVVCKKDDTSGYDIDIKLDNMIKAPSKIGTKVGIATILKDGKVISEQPIVLKENIEKQNVKDILCKMVDNWSIAG